MIIICNEYVGDKYFDANCSIIFNMTFQPIGSIIEPSFWHSLSQTKLNDKMLDETPFNSTGFFQSGRSQGVISSVFINGNSLNKDSCPSQSTHYLNYTACFPITIYLMNTQNSFKTMNRNELLQNISTKIFESIQSREWLSKPSLLIQSALTVFGDLKKWQFYYCFAFPTPLQSAISIKEKSPYNADEIGGDFPDWAFALDDSGKPIPLSQATASSTFAYIDPATNDQPGWPAHILCHAISLTFGITTFKLVRLNVQPLEFTIEIQQPLTAETKFTGWKLNKKKPYFVDLSANMDPLALFKSASVLNLSLMKWRMAPKVDIDLLRQQKVLLVGCGTLGCNVARDLLGWGVRNFTLIDYGKVSFSNPPRQPLFCFNDCLNGGRKKSEAAAEELKRICPDCEVQVDDIEIPMPGHFYGEGSMESIKQNVEKLDSLIQNNDVTFLLTDTRESRWLPTVICSTHNKLCISIALGFDTFSVVRGGSRNVGCYFCNDVVAPVDSMTDRTLDMQCTVTRPGMAPIASAMGVELWASVLQHPEKHNASGKEDSVLGAIPQQIRGFMHSWETLPMSGERFKSCVACADPIITAYKNEGFEFIRKALTQSNYLEELSGIAAMKADMEDIDCEWED